DFHAEVVQLVLADAAFQEGARVDARGAVALDVEQVAGVLVGRGAPEVVEAHVVQGRRRGEGGDVAAQVARLAVGPDDGGHRVPADDRTDAPLQLRVAGALGLLVRRDGVDVLGGRGERQERAGPAGQLDHVLQQCVRTLRAITVDDRLERLDPFPGLYRIRI